MLLACLVEIMAYNGRKEAAMEGTTHTFDDPPPPPPPPLPPRSTGAVNRMPESPGNASPSNLPLARVDSILEVDAPSKHFKPTWYFFYGTLQSSALLKKLLSLLDDACPELIPSTLVDSPYRLAKWGTYLTLIPKSMQLAGQSQISPLPPDDNNGGESQAEQAIVGSAYFVEYAAHAQELQRYETDAYASVECRFLLHSMNEANSARVLVGKVFVYADGARNETDIERWERLMGVSWPLRQKRQLGK